MENIHLSDDDRLSEVGRILALGALRIISKKHQLSSNNVTCRRDKNVADYGRRRKVRNG